MGIRPRSASTAALRRAWSPGGPLVGAVGYQIEGCDIGLDPNGHASGMTGPVSYCDVDDIAQTVEALVAAGAEVKQDVKDVGGAKLTATVTDADGNVIGLIQRV